ncbi:MAG TPA: N-acetylmuramoyl-L-alanine amidase [Candidatus Angelobacter sp.]
MTIGTRIVERTSLAATLACALVFCALSPMAAARTVKQKKLAARTQFETAERLRDGLLGTPESDRTRRDYQKVIDAYRKVYYTAPTYSKADAAVLAVAELLDSQGRVFNDSKSFKDAIGQLAFLRREYPGSKRRVEALFTIAQIYRDDLNDVPQAKATFEDFVKRYPGSSLAPKARKELAEIGNTLAGGSPFKKKPAVKRRVEPEPKAAWADVMPAKPAREKSTAAKADSKPAKPADDTPAPSEAEAAAAPQAPQPAQDAALSKTGTPAKGMPRLTSIRHWSTPDYVRVAIDLEQEVTYQAGRVPHPDRIFFDLYGTKLASDLVGKSFDVETGFLHRIRVAQFKANMARVVLDVDDVAEYSAFLLPNPYRLIIDIHGKLPSKPAQAAAKPDPKASAQETRQADLDDAAAQNDVTVTNVKADPVKKPDTAAGALQRAEDAKAGPAAQKPKAPPAPTTEVARTDLPRNDLPRTDQPKNDQPKTVVDDSTTDTPDTNKTTSKPTTGPTYQAVAPQQSSRTKKKPAVAERAEKTPASTTKVAAPTANGDRSLIRALGLKIGKIVVDAGHGGHDTGTIGPNGLQEKDLVLDVALKLGKLLEKRLGAEVVYTRDDDTFIPLETRTAVANKEQADLFISIHANSSSDSTARGVETYYLNFTSSRDALEVAARENAVSEKSIHELQDLVKKIALKEKIEESREFAADVQKSLYTGLNAKNPGIRNRGVKKAPFIVLIGANMPSILAEISFVSNPGDEKKLKTNEYRQRIAESLYKGVAGYVNGLSGIKVASKAERRSGTAAVASK